MSRDHRAREVFPSFATMCLKSFTAPRSRRRKVHSTIYLLFAPLRELTAKLGDQAEIIDGQAVSGDYFTGLRLNPILGRAITTEDDRPAAAPVVVLSYHLWQDRFD